VAMETADDTRVDVARRRPFSNIHAELLRGAFVNTDDHDVRRRSDGTADSEQPAEPDLFFESQAQAGGTQQNPDGAHKKPESDALTDSH
jgi:hypothetical protein